ncbi:hypothetical protein QBC38DRAFT_371454 [Podospora fimiseda]|uniref:Secreted protein n=1 Tax=Podospora fimiseda TaxID=252190 RepID=A0AAN7BJ27_9PEZI|nr:hypothetical protein QBC38DRAFT_371454 [Podospora fimiseda]
MKTSAIASIATAIMAGLTIASEPIPGYDIVELSWEVKPYLTGDSITLNGTIEQVHAQLLEINPNYDTEVAPVVAEAALAESKQIARRGVISKRDHTICGHFSSANKGRIQQGIDYLWGVGGRPGNGPGPGACGRVSCSYNSAIYWCNDNSYFYQLNGYWEIANGAGQVINDCASGASWVSGQRFYNANWNVIVRGDNC